jgi:hypothetical protein
MCKKVLAYFKKYPIYNSLVHVVIGMGLGILVTYPVAGTHPLRWGLGILAIGLIGHFYPMLEGK